MNAAEMSQAQSHAHGPQNMPAKRSLKWPSNLSLYLIEAGGLGIFMFIAAVAATALEAPASPLHLLLASALVRRVLMGMAMGVTLILLIYSPWGARSGAHFNPALTLTFALLGKIRPADALGYVAGQFFGGAGGVLLARAVLGAPFALPPVSWIVTVPGAAGTAVAFWAEVVMSALMMSVTLYAGNKVRLMRHTGWMCGALLVLFVTFGAPLSGMSLNPARTMASALPSGIMTALWLYFTAPPLGMLTVALVFRHLHPATPVACAKINHDTDAVCLFHCHFAAHGIHVPSLLRRLPFHPDSAEHPLS